MHQQQPPRSEGRQQYVADFRVNLDQFGDRQRCNQQDLARRDGDTVGVRRLAKQQAEFTRVLSGFHGFQNHSVGIAYFQGGRYGVDERVLPVIGPK